MDRGEVTPNPGSDKAYDRGCTCPQQDNYHGAGFRYGGPEILFWVDGACPLHGGRTVEIIEEA